MNVRFGLLIALAVAASALGVACSDNKRGTDAVPATTTTTEDRHGVLGEYEITVTDPDGVQRSATLKCGGGNRGTGYLAGEARARACGTAIAKVASVRYLQLGERPEDCSDTVAHMGWRAEIKGRSWVGSSGGWVPVDRTLVVSDGCDEALWMHLRPLLEPVAILSDE
ncbi:MAG TPA: hypothetical protein VF230_03220 [Acidimicrobiales bacterium]